MPTVFPKTSDLVFPENSEIVIHRYDLQFKRPAGTSRGVLKHKLSWILELVDQVSGESVGYGECGLLRGLSFDDREDYFDVLEGICKEASASGRIEREDLKDWPSIEFALEILSESWQASNPFDLFPSPFLEGTYGIPINGLIWMGEESYMLEQIGNKIEAGFNCIKIKIGALDWKSEWALLQSIRKEFPAQLEIRVDANGGFSPCNAIYVLHQLHQLNIHSIEQPIRQGQWKAMADLCKNSALPVALDEELIGIVDRERKVEMLEAIAPEYIILKPSFIGGYRGTQEWIELAEERNIAWWITSALESNIGLNAIAQWTALLKNDLAQGLGTGALYTNNVESNLEIKKTRLFSVPDKSWNLAPIYKQ